MYRVTRPDNFWIPFTLGLPFGIAIWLLQREEKGDKKYGGFHASHALTLLTNPQAAFQLRRSC
jgi:hypothetical protein